jgi:predicted transposase YdaD
MSIMLRRAETIAPQQKQRIQERLRMFERLWDEDPEIQRIKAEAEAKGEARGEARGKAIGEAKGVAIGEARAIEVSQELVVLVVGSRFPTLTPLVREKVGNIRQPEQLGILARQIATAPDEATARWAIGTFAA